VRYTYEDPTTKQLVTATVESEGWEWDLYCRDHAVEFEDPNEHPDCDAYRSRIRVYYFVTGEGTDRPGTIGIPRNEFFDRNGYCAFHSGSEFDTPSTCANPHDHCSHGIYVGGCGIDYMCHACEIGDGLPSKKIAEKFANLVRERFDPSVWTDVLERAHEQAKKMLEPNENAEDRFGDDMVTWEDEMNNEGEAQ
jgi:hypothetical protein